jgi:hypothetical protein
MGCASSPTQPPLSYATTPRKFAGIQFLKTSWPRLFAQRKRTSLLGGPVIVYRCPRKPPPVRSSSRLIIVFGKELQDSIKQIRIVVVGHVWFWVGCVLSHPNTPYGPTPHQRALLTPPGAASYGIVTFTSIRSPRGASNAKAFCRTNLPPQHMKPDVHTARVTRCAFRPWHALEQAFSNCHFAPKVCHFDKNFTCRIREHPNVKRKNYENGTHSSPLESSASHRALPNGKPCAPARFPPDGMICRTGCGVEAQ